MKTKIISIAEIVVGVFFLANIASDIQLGFGLVLVLEGIKSYPCKS